MDVIIKHTSLPLWQFHDTFPCAQNLHFQCIILQKYSLQQNHL